MLPKISHHAMRSLTVRTPVHPPQVPHRHAPFTVTRVHNPGLHTQGHSPQQGGPLQGGPRQGPTPVQMALQNYRKKRDAYYSPPTDTPQNNTSHQMNTLPTPDPRQQSQVSDYGRAGGFQEGQNPSYSTRPPLNPAPYNGAQRGDSRMSGPSVLPPSSQRRPMPINESGLSSTPRQAAPVYPSSSFHPSPATRPHIRAEGGPPQRDASRTSPAASRSQKPSFGASSQRGPIPIVNQGGLSPTPKSPPKEEDNSYLKDDLRKLSEIILQKQGAIKTNQFPQHKKSISTRPKQRTAETSRDFQPISAPESQSQRPSFGPSSPRERHLQANPTSTPSAARIQELKMEMKSETIQELETELKLLLEMKREVTLKREQEQEQEQEQELELALALALECRLELIEKIKSKTNNIEKQLLEMETQTELDITKMKSEIARIEARQSKDNKIRMQNYTAYTLTPKSRSPLNETVYAFHLDMEL